MLWFGPTDPFAAHLHVLSSTAMRHRVPGFVPGFAPPGTAVVPGLIPLCRGLLSVGSDFASPIDRMGPRLTAQTSRRKLALVAHRYWPAVRDERNCRIFHIPDGPRAPRDAHTRLLAKGGNCRLIRAGR